MPGLPSTVRAPLSGSGKTWHQRHTHLKVHMNNKMEQLNRTIREREVNFRGLKFDTPLILGFQVH